MSLSKFTFKNEAIWMILLSLGLPLIGLFIMLIVWLVRSLG